LVTLVAVNTIHLYNKDKFSQEFIVMKAETHAETAAAGALFPLPAGALTEYFNAFSGFSEAELGLIEGSNLSLAEPTDLAYPLLTLQEFPDLLQQKREGHPQFESRAKCYRAGVCLGLAVVRGRCQTLAAEGAELSPLSVNPTRRYLARPEPAGKRFMKFLMSPMMSGQTFDEIMAVSYPDFCSEEEKALLMGEWLKRSWALQKMSFLTPADILAGNTDYISQGMTHAFYLANAVEGMPPVRHKELDLRYDPKRHLIIPPREHNRGLQLVSESVELEDGDFQSGLTGLEHFLERKLAGGYRARLVEPVTQAGAGGGRYPKTDRGSNLVFDDPERDIWGSNLAPAHAQLTHVRRFEESYAATGDDLNELERVAHRDSIKEFTLGGDDMVIVRGRDGAFATLPHPFRVPTQLTEQGSVVLVALCRHGATRYLKDVSDLPRPEIAALHGVLADATEFQQRRGARARLGRLTLRESVLLGVPAVTAFACSGDSWLERGIGLAAGTAVGLAIVGGRHAQRRQAPRVSRRPVGVATEDTHES
jgi:hypothetical protein